MTQSRLSPAIDTDRLYPMKSAFMARTDLRQTRMLGFTPFNLDAVTTLLMGLVNNRPTIRHRCGVTQEILAVLDRAGLEVFEDMRVYESGAEADRHADALIEAGYKLFWPYPLPEGRFPDHAHLVSPDLWARLNSKQHLDLLVPAANLATRSVRSREQLVDFTFDRPVFLKAGGHAATGWGYAVRYCPDRAHWLSAVEWFCALDEEAPALVEEEVPVRACWCVTIVVESGQTTCVGAAEQVFSAPARQAGSVIDPSRSLPPAGAALAVAVGEAARQAGFVGLAGLDIGQTDDNRFIVFDPNFRFNASSSQVLLHDSAARRSGLTVSLSANFRTPGSLPAIAAKLRGPIDDGWFVPTRLLDGNLHPFADGKSACTGFVLGADRAQAFARQSQLEALLGN